MNVMLKSTWQEEYKRKLCSAEEAVKSIKSGDSIYVQSNAAAPHRIIDAMLARAPKLEGVQIIHLGTLGSAEYAKPEFAASFRVKALFIGANVREAINEGRADYMPIFLGEVPFLLESGELPVDVCLIQVSPPDAHGYCSYGVSVDCTIAARKKAKVVIAEVNKQMPRTHGRSFVHVSRLDHIVESDSPLPEIKPDTPSKEEEDLARFVAELVEDEATIQLGIGSIPNAVLNFLGGKKRLGVHSEMVSDGIVELIEQGVVTNECKTVLPGKAAISFLIGTKKLYNFVDNNPCIELQTSDFINDPYIISRNHKMTAINSALQVDITGQVAADSIGEYLYSGFGGQLDFIRGAARSRSGKAIIALPSTAKDGTVSRITACLPHGAGVVTTRGDVHYVVTEYGIAQLFGRTLRERVNALISIAHPKFRETLEREAHNLAWMH